MKNAQVKHTPLQLSNLESLVCEIIAKKKQIRVIEIAEIVYKNSKKKPISKSNSITSAIRQINRKCEKVNSTWRIVGEFNGRGGKLVYMEHG